MHVPRISKHDDTLLYQILQILDHRAGAAAVARARANRREERARGVGEQSHSRVMGVAVVGAELVAGGRVGDNGAKDGLD